MGHRLWDDRNMGVTWEDVNVWCEQIYEDHCLSPRISIWLPQGNTALMKPSVVVELVSRDEVGSELVKHISYNYFRLRGVGIAEHTALRLLSGLAVELDGDKWRRESQPGQLVLPF